MISNKLLIIFINVIIIKLCSIWSWKTITVNELKECIKVIENHEYNDSGFINLVNFAIKEKQNSVQELYFRRFCNVIRTGIENILNLEIFEKLKPKNACVYIKKEQAIVKLEDKMNQIMEDKKKEQEKELLEDINKAQNKFEDLKKKLDSVESNKKELLEDIKKEQEKELTFKEFFLEDKKLRHGRALEFYEKEKNYYEKQLDSVESNIKKLEKKLKYKKKKALEKKNKEELEKKNKEELEKKNKKKNKEELEKKNISEQFLEGNINMENFKRYVKECEYEITNYKYLGVRQVFETNSYVNLINSLELRTMETTHPEEIAKMEYDVYDYYKLLTQTIDYYKINRTEYSIYSAKEFCRSRYANENLVYN